MNNRVLASLFILLLSLVSWLHSQQPKELNLEQNVPPDSLQTEEDSLKINGSDISKDDTLTVDLEMLKKQLNQIILDKKKKNIIRELPYVIFQENYHLKAPFDPEIIFSQNGFTIQPGLVSNLHLIQSYQLLYEADYLNDLIRFQNPTYGLPVTLADSYLALGDNDMNHVGIKLTKGNIFNLKDLNFGGAYLGYEGSWLGINEKSAAYSLNLSYSLKDFIFFLDHNSIDQQIPRYKLTFIPESDDPSKVKYRLYDISSRISSPYLIAGLRYENTEAEKNTIEILQFLLEKKFSWQNNDLTISFEQIRNLDDDDNETRFNSSGSARIGKFRIRETGFWQKKNNFMLNSDLSFYLWKSIGITTHYEKKKLEKLNAISFSEKKAAGISIEEKSIKTKLLAGLLRWGENYDFLEANISFSPVIGRINSNLTSYLLVIDEKLETYPKWQARNYLDLTINLNHRNAIKFGLIHYYSSSYIYNPFDTNSSYEISTNSLDAYLAFQITDLFLIRLDAVNLTNTDTIFGIESPGNNPETHYNINVNWTFIN